MFRFGFFILLFLLCTQSSVFAVDGFLLKDMQGKVIKNQSEYILTTSRIDGMLRVAQPFSDQFGLVDKNIGMIVIEPKYNSIYLDAAGNFEVSVGFNDIGIISKDYVIIVEPKYYFINLLNGNMYYRLHDVQIIKNKFGLEQEIDKFGVVDIAGNMIIPVDCSWIDKTSNSYEYKIIRNGKEFVFNSKTGILNPIAK